VLPGWLSALALAAGLVLPPRAPAPAQPLPSLPVLSRVRVDVARDHVVVTTDLRFSRGEYRTGDVAFYVAFGVPGAPQAAEAQLVSQPTDVLEVPDGAPAEPLRLERASSRPPNVQPALGRGHVAGLVVRVPGAAFARATDGGRWGFVRIRTLQPMPVPDATGARDMIIRLGDALGQPVTLASVEVAPAAALGAKLPRVEASLCSPKSESRLLSLRGQPLPVGSVAPSLALRLPGDDLCVRFALP
jgi:hypothetical protein